MSLRITASLIIVLLISLNLPAAAAKANDQAKLADANQRWLANADEIADFLSKANPKSWPAGEMKAIRAGR